MSRLIISLAAASLLAAMACAPAATGPSNDQTRAIARGVVLGAEASWVAMAGACLELANDGNTSVAEACEKGLVPAHDSIVLAASLVDTWGDAAQGQFACTVDDFATDMAGVQMALKDGKVTLPQVVSDFFNLTQMVHVTCNRPADAGVKG